MKRIIEGFRYDTEKSILVGEASHGCGGDFSAWRAGLYKTPRAGKFFLAGSGGPMTRWAKCTGQNETTGSTGVIPLDADEALAWAEQHLDPDDIEDHFGSMIEDA